MLMGPIPAPSSASTPGTNKGSDVPNATGYSNLIFGSLLSTVLLTVLRPFQLPLPHLAEDLPWCRPPNIVSLRRTYRQPTWLCFSDPPSGITCNAGFFLYFYSFPTSHHLTAHSLLQLCEALEDAFGKADKEVTPMRNGSLLVHASSKSQSVTFEMLSSLGSTPTISTPYTIRNTSKGSILTPPRYRMKIVTTFLVIWNENLCLPPMYTDFLRSKLPLPKRMPDFSLLLVRHFLLKFWN